jgi:predicted nucleotidyltransferase
LGIYFGVDAFCLFAMMAGMNRTDAIEALKRQADALRALGATSLFLFGSVARDEAGPDSDIDLFIDYDSASRFSAFDLVGIKLFLEEKFRLPVDVTTRDSLHPMLKDRIEQSALRVF